MKDGSRTGCSDADEFPELSALLDAAAGAVSGAVPASFEFEGRRYWLRVRLMMQLDIFETAAAGQPMLRGMSGSLESFGYAPAH